MAGRAFRGEQRLYFQREKTLAVHGTSGRGLSGEAGPREKANPHSAPTESEHGQQYLMFIVRRPCSADQTIPCGIRPDAGKIRGNPRRPTPDGNNEEMASLAVAV